MLYFGLGLGALLVAIGLVTYWLAPRVGPNPWFGVRTGYSVASREVWNASNRAGGLAFVVCGLALGLLAVALAYLGVGQGTATTILTAWLILSLLGALGWLVLYSRRLAQGTRVAGELRPVAFRWAYLAPVLISLALLLVMAVYLYPQLPAQRLATHFDLAGHPDGWMDRGGFLLSFLAIAVFCALLNVAVVLWATREPLIAVDRLGSRWWMSPERGLIFLGLIMATLNLFFAVLLWDVALFNIQGAHPLPMGLFGWLVVPILIVAVAGFFLLAQRRNQGGNSR